MSKLAILGCQNYYRFDSMLAKNVKRHQYFVTQLFMVHLGFLIFCYNFLVIFDTPIFDHLPLIRK